jgi:hypothetical protein
MKGRTWPVFVPGNATQVVNSAPIPNAHLPLDEYFSRFILGAPWTSFIGFQVDKPFGKWQAKFDWYSNVKLADGKSIGVEWTSSNLNVPWFGGSHWIPPTEACNGRAWRGLIIAGLQHAFAPAC